MKINENRKFKIFRKVRRLCGAGEYPEMSWGLEVSELLIHKDISTLEYHGKFIAEIPTIEIYKMLKAYRDKLKDYENKSPAPQSLPTLR